MMCGGLAAPANGEVSVSGLAIGSVATYSCRTGFLLVGGAKLRVCSVGGVWSSVAPVCKSRSFPATMLSTRGMGTPIYPDLPPQQNGEISLLPLLSVVHKLYPAASLAPLFRSLLTLVSSLLPSPYPPLTSQGRI